MVRNSVCAVLIFLLAGVVQAGDPNEILVKVKAASGGAAWDAIRTARTKATISIGGLSGTTEALDDVTAGRYVDRFQLGPMSGAEGFDGTVAWSQDASGQSRAEEGGDARLGAANESYRRAYGFWRPDRWPAQIEDAGTQQENGRQFFVVRITPKGGRPFDLWIDRATMLIDRTVEKTAMETRTTFVSDYRTVGGVKIAVRDAVHQRRRALRPAGEGRERRVQRASRRRRVQAPGAAAADFRLLTARPPPPSRSS